MHNSSLDKLVLFYVGDISESNLRKYLTELLPEYMIPNELNKLIQMPLNANGKIDRSALKNQADKEQ